MATQTPNYNLTKPAQTDFYDVDVFNDNFEKIDTAINNASYIIDASTGKKYRFGIDSNGLFFEEVV